MRGLMRYGQTLAREAVYEERAGFAVVHDYHPRLAGYLACQRRMGEFDTPFTCGLSLLDRYCLRINVDDGDIYCADCLNYVVANKTEFPRYAHIERL